MSKNHNRVIPVKINNKNRQIVAIMVFLAVFAMIGLDKAIITTSQVFASECPDLKVLFARGSGGERYNNSDYNAFKDAMDEKLKTSNLSYEFDDLDYPAISIDVSDGHLDTLLNAFIGGGESYDFGDSVHAGTKELQRVINNGCEKTKYVLAGYSQGGIVLLDALSKIDSSKIIYTATFGDPKIYLPEGLGPVPTACSGRGLSDYRIYVPDCKAYKGILGARNPYVMNGYTGKIGTWCNKYDVLCSSYYSVDSHISYARDGLYEDASRYIFSKIANAFGFKNQYTSPHDTAILIDSTGSMRDLIEKYKSEALRLAEKTLNAGGRVALYDYRDVNDHYTPIERCNFKTCDLATFQNGLNAITTGGGGDKLESTLSASFHVMKSLKWKLGSTKSLVILTDSGYHSPDLDGTTFYDVVSLSKQIDPVSIYIVTTDDNTSTYQSLADETGGAVSSSTDNLSIMTDEIMSRFDSLPRVEESDDGSPLPTLEVTNTEDTGNEIKIRFKTTGIRTIVIINDKIMGQIEGTDITIGELDRTRHNIISLVPLSANRRGETASFDIKPFIPKTPDTGTIK